MKQSHYNYCNDNNGDIKNKGEKIFSQYAVLHIDNNTFCMQHLLGANYCKVFSYLGYK